MSGDPRFSIIPARAIYDNRLVGQYDLKILCHVGKHADKNGWWRLSQTKIANALNCGRTTVVDAVKRLEECHLVEKHHTTGENGRHAAPYFRVIYDIGEPEKGVPGDVLRERKKGETTLENDQDQASNDRGRHTDTSVSGVGTPTGGVGPGPTPNITEHSNETLSRDARAQGARDEREDENKLFLDADMKRALHVAWGHWDKKLGGSINKIELEACKLTADEFARAVDTDRIDCYHKSLTSAGRDYFGAYSTYIKDRKFDCDAVNEQMASLTAKRDAEAKDQQFRQETRELKPYGKYWMAERLRRLAAGEDLAGLDYDRKRQDELPPHEHFVAVPGDGEEWRHWREWHAANGHELPGMVFPAWVWVPSKVPPPYPQMVWEILPRSAEFVRAWFKECQGLKGDYLRKQYDNAIKAERPIKSRSPVLKELQVIYLVAGEDGWQEFQAGLATLDRKTLDAEPGKTWDIPVDLFEFVNNAAE